MPESYAMAGLGATHFDPDSTVMTALPRLPLQQVVSAVVLAGGRSHRMGRDKALLECGGVTLIRRQLLLLREVGLEDIFIAARSAEDYAGLGYPVLADAYHGRGPLAGLERALQAARCPLVFALAVDLPRLTARLLARLLEVCRADRGVVPRLRGELEPLVACYPQSAWSLAVECLDSGQNSARAFALACVDRGWVECVDLPDETLRQFENWNRPEDASGG